MAVAATKTNTEDVITPVGPGADEEEAGAVIETGEGGAGEDYRYPEGEDESPEGGEERTGHADTETDPDAGSGLTREQKRRRKRREKLDRTERENQFLRYRNEQLERQHSQRLAQMEQRQTQSDVTAIDGRITQAHSDLREAEALLAQALEAKDHGAVVEALRVRDEFRDGLRQLQGTKQQTVQQARSASQAPQQAAPDPVVAQRVREWSQEHAWFDSQLRDDDSAIVRVVEARLLAEGRLHPSTDAYWEELDRRLAKRLPEHYRTNGRDSDEEDDRTPRREALHVNGKAPRRATGPTIKVGGRERTLRKGEVYIDEDRKKAMIEKGVWDDPVLRERQLRYFQQYDRDAGRRPR